MSNAKANPPKAATTKPAGTESGKTEGDAQATPKTVKGIRVIAQVEGFRRAGRAFGQAPTDIRLDDLKDDELERIKNEPRLAHVFIDMPAPDGDAAAGAEGAPET